MMANNSSSDIDGGEYECDVRSALQASMHHRMASLTEVEKAFLSALLIDRPEDEARHKKKVERAKTVLDNDVLFSLPVEGGEGGEDSPDIEISRHRRPKRGRKKSHPRPPRPTRSNVAQIDLWKAHRDGVRPVLLRKLSKQASLLKKGSSGSNGPVVQSPSSESQNDGAFDDAQQSPRRGRRRSRSKNQFKDGADLEQNAGGCESQGVTGEVANSLDGITEQQVGSLSTASSWNSSQGGFDHYDAWEVLRDEYAEDFGFKVAVDDEDELLPCGVYDDDGSDQHGVFKILGTSLDDARALPHVLSPPVMDSLLAFVPDHLAQGGNFWLKFSLVRDGASLPILRQYCRAATHTVLAIETTNGQVFGAFVSSAWHLDNKYFGTGEAFLWRMRHGRNTPVHSLFEQAQLESEIDVFPFNGSNDYVQLCTNDKLALGGGTVLTKEASIREVEPLDDPPAAFLEDALYGFGLALDRNLLHGTTSPCATFGNPNLASGTGSGETFDVMNLEVWGFTSAQTERDAERSEMSMFFVRESVSSNLSSSTQSDRSLFSGDDLSQDRFYRRVGQNDESESDRDAWQYSNMMNPVAGSPYRSMGSPYESARSPYGSPRSTR
ncbi:hypothetical protein ACHAWF_003850 [Thalassiosira exigua]